MKWLSGWSAAAVFEGQFSNVTGVVTLPAGTDVAAVQTARRAQHAGERHPQGGALFLGGLLFAGSKWQLNAIGQNPEGPFIFRVRDGGDGCHGVAGSGALGASVATSAARLLELLRQPRRKCRCRFA